MFVSTATPVAPSTGLVVTRTGASASVVVKFRAVGSVIPAYGLPAWSVNAPAAMST